MLSRCNSLNAKPSGLLFLRWAITSLRQVSAIAAPHPPAAKSHPHLLLRERLSGASFGLFLARAYQKSFIRLDQSLGISR